MICGKEKTESAEWPGTLFGTGVEANSIQCSVCERSCHSSRGAKGSLNQASGRFIYKECLKGTTQVDHRIMCEDLGFRVEMKR